MTLDQALILAGVVVAALAILVPIRYSQRKDATEQDEKHTAATRQAVVDAVAPITADRDYWRQRANQFEDELRRRRDDD